ncbi:50S ribosomal protein L10 [bacterium]|nr:50S ribosomal protein L10 [bacterium]
MARPEKELVVDKVVEIFQKASGVFVTDYKGLNVEQISEFRNQCRENSVEYLVVKNTLARIAAKKVGRDEMIDYFKGPSAIAYSFDNPSAPAKVITGFVKKAKVEKPSIRFSLFEGNFYGPDRVEEIAALPSKNELYALLLGGFNAPISGFVGTLSGLLQKFVGTLQAIKEDKDKDEA